MLSALFRVALIGLIVCFWWAYASNQDLRRSRLDYLQRSPRPFLLNGTALALEQFVEPQLARTRRTGNYLVLVSSDECPFSRQAVSPWSELLERIHFREHDSVVLLSADGGEIPRQLIEVLQRRRVPHQLLRVTNQNAFAQATGLSATPTTIVLDADARVRYVSGRLTDGTSRAIGNLFGGLRESSN